MRIGIIGSGEMGGSLGRLWAQAGHEIMFSSRHPHHLKALAREAGSSASTGSVRQAVEFAEVILLAVNFNSLDEAVRSARRFDGKIVIDVTNPVTWDENRERIIPLRPHGVTAVSELRKKAPLARIVKAFSHLPAQFLMDPLLGPGISEGEPLTVFHCGDDPAAKQVAAKLIEDAGFTPFDIGGLEQAVHMEIPGELAFKAVPLEEARRLFDQLPRESAA